MSVSIATMGLFRDCCGGAPGGGGAPPYRREDERVTPYVRVTDVEIKSIKVREQMFKNISVKLLNEDNE
jgi:hypothetical protein